MTSVALGTSSWQFDAWRGVFYPEAMKAADYLAHYARQLRTVEVNTTFYAIPRQSTVQRWTDSVPDGFTFCLKFPRVITHEKRLIDCEAESEAFLDIIRLLGDKAAPCFLQFPASFTRERHGLDLARYLDWFAEAAADLRIAVEVRAADLWTPAFAAFLAERGLALLLADRVNTRDMYGVWYDLIETGAAPGFALIRWIGDDKNGPTGDRELTDLRDEDLARWTQRLVALQAHAVDVFGYMHNPYEGHAPASVRRLEALLRKELELPPWLPPSPEESSGQLSLFG